MNITLIKAVFRAKKNGLLRLVPATEITRLDCLAENCAECCKNLGSPLVTAQEAERIDSNAIVKDKSGMFIKSSKSVCCLLKDGFCSVYDDRPKGCREYPWYNVDGKLYYDGGCPGIKHDMDQRPDVESIQPFENFFPDTSKLILWLIKKYAILF